MFVMRFTHTAKQGRTRELAEHLKSFADYGIPRPPHGWRVYQSTHLGRWGVVIQEIEFENLAQFEDYMSKRNAAPRFGEAYARYLEFAEPSGSGELWRVETLQ
jgi:hypothetical protein